ncbi:MAG: hypothetical protein JNK88_11575 [Mangrovicoccus sp.]|nr:hypothetical protein [Mangrovicoccus sp.]
MRSGLRAAILAAIFPVAALADGAPPDEAALGLSAPFGAATQVLATADWAASPPALRLSLLDAAGHEVGAIPVPETEAAYFDLRGLTEADVDGDGDGDLVALAEYASGVGPSGAAPYPQAMVWLRGPEGFAPAPGLVETVNGGDDPGDMAALVAAIRAAAGG